MKKILVLPEVLLSKILHKLKLWSRRPRKDLQKFRSDLKSANYYTVSHRPCKMIILAEFKVLQEEKGSLFPRLGL